MQQASPVATTAGACWPAMPWHCAWAAIASSRGWGWPALARAVAFVGATILAYCPPAAGPEHLPLGRGARASNDLFTVTYPTDHLGFTYPPFSALLFAPFAHFPAAPVTWCSPGSTSPHSSG